MEVIINEEQEPTCLTHPSIHRLLTLSHTHPRTHSLTLSITPSLTHLPTHFSHSITNSLASLLTQSPTWPQQVLQQPPLAAVLMGRVLGRGRGQGRCVKARPLDKWIGWTGNEPRCAALHCVAMALHCTTPSVYKRACTRNMH